jgi:Cu(I)/Ag(I) efflux system membrane protein CusA/SilA
MLLFPDLVRKERVRAGHMRTAHDLEEAIVHGAVKRARPKMTMTTVGAAFAGLLPIM